MAGVKMQFYRHGSDSGKRCNATVDLRRPDITDLKKWTPKEKDDFLEWLKSVEEMFPRFIQGCKESLTTPTK